MIYKDLTPYLLIIVKSLLNKLDLLFVRVD
jgi:hypothetical protein